MVSVSRKFRVPPTIPPAIVFVLLSACFDSFPQSSLLPSKLSLPTLVQAMQMGSESIDELAVTSAGENRRKRKREEHALLGDRQEGVKRRKTQTLCDSEGGSVEDEREEIQVCIFSKLAHVK